MKTHARAVVIGGGIVGVSTLYHLAKKGWSDAVLCERTELTAGSTWHAAGLLPLFNMSYGVGQLHKYSVDLYKTLPGETGQDVSFHATGNLRLATSEERMDEYRKYCGTANTIGVPFEIVTPDEVAALWPLCNTDGLVGALYHPDDGHIAPADVTQALAIGARNAGADIYRNTPVTDIERKAGGEWLVRTPHGDIACEHVVCATGNYSWHTGRMLGIYIPAMPVEHQYIVTEEVPELVERHRQGLPEMAVLRESDASYYLREERRGYILGPYEKGAPARFGDGVPDSFERDLFPGDLDRLMPHLEAASARVPSFESAGIRDVVNGPIAYTPDGSPLVGPAWGLRNVWLNEGHSFGITAAGGAGWQLAEWIVEGEPSIDMIDVDPRRFGAYANKRYVKAKNEEAYEHVFVIHYPDEERPAARPAKTAPIHDLLDGMGAVWGQRYGWERPNWFAPPGVERRDVWSFRRTNYFPHVAREHRNVRENVGIVDITGFSKFRVSGPGAEAWLDRLVCRRLPRAIGRINLAHALTPRGGVRSEFTVMRDGEDSFYLVSSGAAERFDEDYLSRNLPADASVRLDNLTTSHATLVVAGPNARAVMSKIAEADLDNDAFPWLTGQRDPRGARACAPDAHQLPRRARVGDSPSDGIPAAHLSRAAARGLGIRYRPMRDARHGFAANRKVLSHVGAGPDARVHDSGSRTGTVRRPRQGRLRRPRRAGPPARGGRAAGIRHRRGERHRRRRPHGQRAAVAGWRHGRARDGGRLWPFHREVPCAGIHRRGPRDSGHRDRDRNSRKALPPPG